MKSLFIILSLIVLGRVGCNFISSTFLHKISGDEPPKAAAAATTPASAPNTGGIIKIPKLVPGGELPPGPVLIIEREKEFASLLTHHDLDYEETCKLKQGYVAEVTGIILDDKKNELIHARPLFAVLNEKTLAFFENENVNALIKSIDIRHINPPQRPEKWEIANINCFKITLSKTAKPFKKDEEKSEEELAEANNVASVCLETSKQMKKWMSAISDFHNCIVKEVSEESSKKESMGMKIRRAALEDEEKKEEERIGEEKNMEEENEKKQIEVDEKQMKSLDEELSDLKKNLLKDKIRRAKELRKLDEERKKAEEKTKKLADEQKCLERALEVKTVEEEKTAELLIKMEEEDRDKMILKKASEKLVKQTDKSKDLIKQQEEYVIEAQKKMQEMIKGMMVQSTVEFEKLLDPRDCYSPELIGMNTSYIKGICSKLPDPLGPVDIKLLTECLEPTSFCSTCCSHYIGVSHEVHRMKCTDKCNKLMFPDTITEDIPGVMFVKVPYSSKVEKVEKTEGKEEEPTEEAEAPKSGERK